MLLSNVKISAFCVLTFLSGTASAEWVVIAHPRSEIAKLDTRRVGAIFMKLETDSGLEPYDQAAGRAIRKDFYQRVVNKTENHVNAYWARLRFTGKGVPPKALQDDEAVKQRVAADPRAIGYIDSSLLDASVKVVYSP